MAPNLNSNRSETSSRVIAATHTYESTLIHCGLSQAFYNKTNCSGSKAAFSNSFIPSQVTPIQLVEHITQGKAWTQGHFNGKGRRKDHFISAQTLALDLDEHISVADALNAPLITQYALLVHPSPSSTPAHPKTRVVFLLSEAITDVKYWETLQRALISHFADLQPDPACKDAARMFYGSDVPGAHIQLEAVLPLAVVEALIPQQTAAPQPSYPATTAASIKKSHTYTEGKPTRTGRYEPGEVSSELVNEVERLLGVSGAAINSDGFTRQAIPCPMHHHEHDHDRPAAHWHTTKHFLHCFKCGADYNTHQIAEALNITIADYYQKQSAWERVSDRISDMAATPETTNPVIKSVELPTLSANMYVTERYIGEVYPEHWLLFEGILIKSPIGTGKTQAAAMLVKKLAEKLGRSPKVLAITHRQALAEDLANRLGQDSNHIFECYKGLEAADLRRISRLAICYDSLWKLATVGKKLPQYDLIIIDEIEQFHMHLGGDTMKGNAAERAYRVLRQLVNEADHFLGMDAHLTDVSRQWLMSIREDIRTDNDLLCIENHYVPERGNLTLHKYREAAIRTALDLAHRDEGTVVLATNTRAMAKRLGHIFTEAIGEENVRVIHGGNSNDRDVQQFIRNINQELPQLRVLIYSPSLGTGVNIQAPVRAVVGVFSQRPLAPADMHQMLGRCRHAQERHAWVQTIEGNNTTDWWTIFRRHEDNALNTGLHCEFDRNGVLAITPIQRSMLKLLAMLEAQRNRSINQPLDYFVALAHKEGYQLGFCEAQDDATREQLKAAQEEIQQMEKDATLAAEPVEHAEYELLRSEGNMTPEIEFGYERFKIEDCVGQTITPQLYDDLHTSTKREALRRFTDLDEDEETLREYDRQEARHNTLVSHRKHRAVRRKLVQSILVAVWGRGYAREMVSQNLTVSQINARLEGFLNDNWHNLTSYLGWRSDQSRQPVAVLRWVLAQVGLSLESQQIMIEGERFRVYSVPGGIMAKMQYYACTRRQHRQEKAEKSTDEQRAFHGLDGRYSKYGDKHTIAQRE